LAASSALIPDHRESRTASRKSMATPIPCSRQYPQLNWPSELLLSHDCLTSLQVCIATSSPSIRHSSSTSCVTVAYSSANRVAAAAREVKSTELQSKTCMAKVFCATVCGGNQTNLPSYRPSEGGPEICRCQQSTDGLPVTGTSTQPLAKLSPTFVVAALGAVL
jgi:hypothetical protein